MNFPHYTNSILIRILIFYFTAKPFWPITSEYHHHTWCSQLSRAHPKILSEFKRMTKSSKISEGNNVWVSAADSESAASYGPDWKTLVLCDRTTWDPINTRIFPKTTKILRELEGNPVVEAFFARMDERSEIGVHTDRSVVCL